MGSRSRRARAGVVVAASPSLCVLTAGIGNADRSAGRQETLKSSGHVLPTVSFPRSVAAGDPVDVRLEDATACSMLCDERAQIFVHGQNRAVESVSSEPAFAGAARVLTIPGEEVRFPGVRFHVVTTLPDPDTGVPQKIRFPKRGSYRVRVVPEVRARFLKPDGSPASSARVFVAPGFGHGGVFATETDAEGRIDVQIPTGSRYMRNQRRVNGYTNAFISTS